MSGLCRLDVLLCLLSIGICLVGFCDTVSCRLGGVFSSGGGLVRFLCSVRCRVFSGLFGVLGILCRLGALGLRFFGLVCHLLGLLLSLIGRILDLRRLGLRILLDHRERVLHLGCDG